MKIKTTVKNMIMDWASRACLSENVFIRTIGSIPFKILAFRYQTLHCDIEEIKKAAETIAGPQSSVRFEADIRRCWRWHGFMPAEYLSFHFSEKGWQERKTYYSAMDLKRFATFLNERTGEKLLSDKYATYLKFKNYFHREVLLFNGKNIDEVVHSEFTKRHSTFFAKPLSSYGGHGLQRVHFADDSAGQLSCFLEKMGPCILEEPIQQHCDMAAFHPASLNTIRVATLLDPSTGTARCWFAFLRTGQGASVVDNASSGGLFAQIDVKSGMIVSDGYDMVGGSFAKHPDTGHAFKGFVIPQWTEIETLAKALAREFPLCHYVSWDFAVSPNGVVLIEANAQGALFFRQIAERRGLKTYYDEVLLDMGRKLLRQRDKDSVD